MRCLKASSPPTPARAHSEPPTHPPGVHLRGLSVTIASAHRPALGFSLIQDVPQGHPEVERDAGSPRTHTPHEKRSSGHTNLSKASPRLGFPGHKEADSLRKDDRPQTETSRQDGRPSEAVAAPRPEQCRHQEVGKPLWYLTRTSSTLLVLQALFIILFTAFVR